MSAEGQHPTEPAAAGYARLADMTVKVAQSRGYAGHDPITALSHLAQSGPDMQRLMARLSDWWRLNGGDEDDPETARALANAGTDAEADCRLALAMVDHLEQGAERRVSQTVNFSSGGDGRDQALIGELLSVAVSELGTEVELDDPPHKLLGALIKRYREELSRRRDEARLAREQHLGLLEAIQGLAAGYTLEPEDFGADAAIVEALAQTFAKKDHLAQQYAELSAERNKLAHHVTTLSQELADIEEQRRVTAQAEPSEDARLALYREAFSTWKDGGDPGPMLEDIRDKERVFPVKSTEAERIVRAIDRALEGLSARLAELRRISPLSEDPKRYRPRLLGSSVYKLKTLAGVLQAIRDAGVDLGVYIDRARYVAGRRGFIAGLDDLRPVFQEMVRLVGDCRQQVDDGHTLSISIQLDTTTGLASLPGVLAADIHDLLALRGGKKQAEALLPLVEECVDHYRKVLGRVLDTVPPKPEEKRRTRPPARLETLALHLEELAGAQADYADGVEQQPAAGDERLADDPDLFLRGLREVDSALEIIASLPGAPELAVQPLPGVGNVIPKNLAQIYAARKEFLIEVGKYRVQILG